MLLYPEERYNKNEKGSRQKVLQKFSYFIPEWKIIFYLIFNDNFGSYKTFSRILRKGH
jgi:hypothetical protein